MSTQRYSVTPQPIDTLLHWIKIGEISIPEIQRPFVWEATKVRNLLDSLYQGYPVGYLIAWRNPTVKLKDGTLSAGKRILIDGQQRVTALMAALLGREVLTKDYETVRIRIAFHPGEERFEVTNPAIQKDVSWISDVSDLFSPEAKLLQITKAYATANPGVDQDVLFGTLEKLRKIVNNHVGIIELAEDLDIETVTEIFIRVNSAGAALSQADFAMSKIAANESYGGNELRKAIDYFCHLAVAPEFFNRIQSGDKTFAKSDFFQKMSWIKDVNDDLYDPSYTDMLRVAFANSDLIGGQNAVNFAYIIFLRGRADNLPAAEIERLVRRWYVMSVLTGRYSGNPETAFDFDIRQIDSQGLAQYLNAVINAQMSDSFWNTLLPQNMDTSSSNSPYFLVFQAAQTKLNDRGFLSRDITVRDLVLNRSDVHHIFPRNHLKKQGLSRGRYNQIANYAVTQTEINIAIGDRDPVEYFSELGQQCASGSLKYGGITDRDEMEENLGQHCIPGGLDGVFDDYETFLAERRKLMASRVREYFSRL
jgi:hypothetical protein